MSYYPGLLPTRLHIMAPYSPRITHKIYKCDNKTSAAYLFMFNTLKFAIFELFF